MTDRFERIASVKFDPEDGYKPDADFYEIIRLNDEERKMMEDSIAAMTSAIMERLLPEECPEDADEYKI